MRRAPTAPLPAVPTTSTDPVTSPSTATPAPSAAAAGGGFIKVRTHYENDVFVIAIPSRGATFSELQARIERKIKLCGSQSPGDLGRVIKMRYRAESGDFVNVMGDADVAEAFDVARRGRERGVLNLYVQ